MSNLLHHDLSGDSIALVSRQIIRDGKFIASPKAYLKASIRFTGAGRDESQAGSGQQQPEPACACRGRRQHSGWWIISLGRESQDGIACLPHVFQYGPHRSGAALHVSRARGHRWHRRKAINPGKALQQDPGAPGTEARIPFPRVRELTGHYPVDLYGDERRDGEREPLCTKAGPMIMVDRNDTRSLSRNISRSKDLERRI